MGTRKPRRWREAEWMYEALCADRMLPLLNGPLSPDQLHARLQGIVDTCDRFYPAVLELGIRQLMSAATAAEGERLVDDGFRLLLELSKPDHLTEEVEAVVDNLERVWRFDLQARHLQTMVSRDPSDASWHDSLAHALAWLGELEAATREQAEAVRLAPDNPNLRNNQGFVHLALGRLGEARVELEEAARLDVETEVVEHNLRVLSYLEEHGGSHLDYLLRPLDLEEVERLSEAEEWEEVDALCASYDSSRLQLLILAAMQGDEGQRRRLPDLVSTLSQLFRFVRQVRSDAYHLNEDVVWLTRHFQPLMHKFIFKHGDADGQLVEEVCDALLELYALLASRKVIRSADHRAFVRVVRKLRPELVRKAESYRTVRHDPQVSTEERERIQDELFDGDHLWPGL
jgi:hypothetical protein